MSCDYRKGYQEGPDHCTQRGGVCWLELGEDCIENEKECAMCGQPFHALNTNICGSCADILRDEKNAAEADPECQAVKREDRAHPEIVALAAENEHQHSRDYHGHPSDGHRDYAGDDAGPLGD